MSTIYAYTSQNLFSEIFLRPFSTCEWRMAMRIVIFRLNERDKDLYIFIRFQLIKTWPMIFDGDFPVKTVIFDELLFFFYVDKHERNALFSVRLGWNKNY